MSRVKRSVWVAIAVFGAVLFAAALFCAWQNNALQVTRFLHRLPEGVGPEGGFTLVQVSDLHNKRFGRGQERLLSEIAGLEPDAILITGDVVDRRRYDPEPALELVRGAAQLAPVFFVTGNHEAWSGRAAELLPLLEAAGATVLQDEAVELFSGVMLAGVDDPAFESPQLRPTSTLRLEQALEGLGGGGGFKVLLSHRPELFELYCEAGMGAVFAGHAHGGQVRLPWGGGLYAPNQGFFPKYSEGSHSSGGTVMYVSRGLGNSIFPLRIFNRPELVAVYFAG